MKKLCLLLSLAFVLCTSDAFAKVITYENDLAFHQEDYDSLDPKYKELYKLITQGLPDLPLGSSRDDIIDKMGPPQHQSISGLQETLYYYDRSHFRVVLFDLTHNKLTAMLFLVPTTPYSRITHSDIDYLNGRFIFGFQNANHSNGYREMYIDHNLHQYVEIGFSPSLHHRTASLKRMCLGYISTSQMVEWEIKSLLRYAEHVIKYVWKHHTLPQPASRQQRKPLP